MWFKRRHDDYPTKQEIKKERRRRQDEKRQSGLLMRMEAERWGNAGLISPVEIGSDPQRVRFEMDQVIREHLEDEALLECVASVPEPSWSRYSDNGHFWALPPARETV